MQEKLENIFPTSYQNCQETKEKLGTFLENQNIANFDALLMILLGGMKNLRCIFGSSWSKLYVL